MIDKMEANKLEPQCKPLPIAVVMITLNEAHNLEAVLDNIQGWAEEVFIVDSYSSDKTVDIALRRGVHVVQRAFRGFGDQWNFALNELPIKSDWVMKIDPDERITEHLKREIKTAICNPVIDAYLVNIELFFMGRSLPVSLKLLRLWRADSASFSDVLANEHAVVSGEVGSLCHAIEHYDSPDLQHWYNKQNKYTTAESLMKFRGAGLADEPRLLGTPLQRKMYLKENFYKFPFRYIALFAYHYLYLGTFRSGRVGYIWSKLRVEVYRTIEYKLFEMKITGKEPINIPAGAGLPDKRVTQYD